MCEILSFAVEEYISITILTHMVFDRIERSRWVFCAVSALCRRVDQAFTPCLHGLCGLPGLSRHDVVDAGGSLAIIRVRSDPMAEHKE